MTVDSKLFYEILNSRTSGTLHCRTSDILEHLVSRTSNMFEHLVCRNSGTVKLLAGMLIFIGVILRQVLAIYKVM